jgi:DedD protein
MAESQDALLVKKRARRRLIGAIALVLFVVIALPMVLDKEPKPLQNEISVQIPSQDSTNFNARVPPPAVPAPPPSSAAEKSAPEPQAKPELQPAPKSVEKAPVPVKSSPKAQIKSAPEPVMTAKAEQARAQAILEGDTWVVALGAFSNSDNVKQLQAKLSAAGVKSFTEAVKTAQGEQTRVRAGPFKTREDAEKARDKLKAADITVGIVTTR